MKLASVLLTASSLFAQDAIQGPVTGWLWDHQNEAMRPVLGIPGASILGANLESGVTLAKAASDQRSYSLGIGAEDRQAYLQLFRSKEPAQWLKSVPAGADRFVLSPSGDSAIFYYADSVKLALVTGLPANPRLVREIELTAEGEPASFAVNDGATVMLLAYPADRTTLVVDSDGNRWKLNRDGAVQSLTFADQSSDALIADDRGVWLIRNVNGSPEERQLFEGDTAYAAVSADRRHVVAAARNGRIHVIALDGTDVRTLECACEPTRLTRMAGGSVFQLNEAGDHPVWLVDLNSAEPRTVFVPADAKGDQ